jgi:hypothetical protein
MQIIKSAACLILFFCPIIIFAQTTYLPEGSKEYHLMDRLEIKQGQLHEFNFSTLRPFSRRSVVQEAEYVDSISILDNSSLIGDEDKNIEINLTAVDKYNLHIIR